MINNIILKINKKYNIFVLSLNDSGKTCLIKRYLEDRFAYNTLRTISDYFFKRIELDNGKSVGIKIHDTPSSERFMGVIKNHIKIANGIIIVYDISYRRTLEDARQWLDYINENIPNRIPIVLVGNKIDIDDEYDSYTKREISTEEGQQFANDYNLIFYETSAKNGTNVKECFDNLIHEIYLNDPDFNIEYENSIKLSNKRKERPGKKGYLK